MKKFALETNRLRVSVVDEDLLVVATTQDAMIVRGKSQTPNGAFVCLLHFGRVPSAVALVK